MGTIVRLLEKASKVFMAGHKTMSLFLALLIKSKRVEMDDASGNESFFFLLTRNPLQKKKSCNANNYFYNYKAKLLTLLLIGCCLFFTKSVYSQASIWANTITATDPSLGNPYTNGQTLNGNLIASGIGRALSLNASTAIDRYSASGWSTSASIDLNKYFTFTITPNTGYKINLSSVSVTTQRSNTGPASFAFRTNASSDNFTSNVGSVTTTTSASANNISLTGAAYQNISSTTEFRLFGWSATAGTGTFSVNDFTFSGSILGTSINSLTGFSTCINAVSTAQSFTINGDGLISPTALITIAGSANYEVSVTSAMGGFANSATFNASAGAVNKTVWVRLKFNANAGTYNGEIINVSGGGFTAANGINVTVGGTVQDQSTAPSVTSPICSGSTTVNGTSSEANGTTINVFKSGATQIGTATVNNGTWSATVSALSSGDAVTAIAQVASKCASNSSGIVTINPLPAITSASTTSNVCFSPLAQTAQLTYSNATNSPDKYSITWNASATAAGFTTVTDATLPSSPIIINVPAGTAPGTYTGNISVKNSTTGCTSGTTPFTLTVTTVASATLTITPGTNVCQNTDVTYSTQAGQSNYLWTVSGVQGPDYIITGGSTSTTSNTVTIKWIKAGTYNVNVSFTSGTCAAIPATSTTTVNAAPTVFNVSGGGNYCVGGSGITVTLSGSETGVNYQLKNGATNEGSPLAGTGSALSFNNITGVGTYTVIATNTTTNCTATMGGSAGVSITPRPSATINNTSTAICKGGSTNVTGTVTATGAWTLTLDNSGGSYNGASGATAFSIAVSPSATTTYNIASLTDASGCATMPGDLTGSTTITVNPTPTLSNASQAAPVCAGTTATVNLTGLAANSTATVSYSISGTAQAPVSVTANASGNGNFTTPTLTTANNGQTLQITSITITSATPNCSAMFTQNLTLAVSNCSPVTQFYVNDNSTSGDSYTGGIGNDANPGTQALPFATINHAISVAQSGSTIYVDAGTYAENVNVNKSLTILGSNAAINPNTGTRVSEAIVVPTINNVSAGRIFDVNADNVSIKGFTIDGDNTAISGGYNANGADNNAALGIACGDDPSPDGFNNILVENNIIKNLGNATNFNAAFYGSGSQSGARTGSNFQNNKVDNTVLWGIVTENNFYINVQNNVITRTGRGIQFDNTWIGSVPVTIAGNNVKYYRRGILINLRYGTASPVTVSGNAIQPETSGNGEDGMPGAAAVNRGLMVWSIAASAGNVTLTDNNISNAWYGEELWNNAPGKVSQTGGVLNGNHYGIYLPTNQDAYGNAAYGSNASVTRATINNSVADGVWLNDNNASANTVNLSLTNAFITGGVNSIRVSGSDVAATINNNSLTGSSAKAIDASTFTNATPISATCTWYGSTDNTVVSSKVSGNAVYMPYITDGTDSDPATSGFQPMANSCNSAVQFYVNDGSTANGVYTTSVGNDANPGTSSQPFATVGHAVLVAPAGATIYVDAGTYQEQVVINKSLNIEGAGRGGASITRILSPGTLAMQTSGSGAGHRPVLMAKGEGNTINIKKVLIDGAGVGGANFYGLYYDEASGTFEDSRITAVRNTPLDGMQDGEAFFANHAYDVSKAQTITINNNIIDDYQKTGILINELNTHAIITNNIITGAGPVNFIAQNGIQLAFGAYGTVSNNTITGNYYIDPTNTYDASGIILYGVGVDQNGVATGNATTISNNMLSANGTGLLTAGDGDFGYSSNKGLTEGPNTYANNLIQVWLADIGGVGTNPTPNGSNIYNKRVDNTAKTNIVYGQIQKAVSYASAGHTLNASAHTFTEQVEIPKSLTLNGAGAGTVIQSPATLPLSFTSSASNRPVVYAHDAATVVLNNFTVDGAGQGNANIRFVGIGYYNAGGTVQNTEVKGIRSNPIDGVQGGTGIVAFANNGTARTLNVTNNNVHDFQKNATAFSGANLTVNVNGNTVTGAGAVAFIAQNGVQISSGATGTITNNTISGFAYTGTEPASSSGVLVFGAGGNVTTSGNTVNDAQVGIYYANASGTVTTNSINYNAANMGGTYWYGIDVENGTVSVIKNSINGDGNGAGIEADYNTGETTNLIANNNFINNTDEAVVVYAYTPGSGTATINTNENSIVGYTTAAVHNYGTTAVNATCNWYGTTDNSLIAPKIMGSVTYVSYLVNGTDNDGAMPGFQSVPGSCSGPAALSASISSQTNVACFGGTTGTVTVTASGGLPNYQYSIDGGANYGASGTFSNLAAGNYTVTAKDAAGNTTTQAVNITQPMVLTVSATQINNACHGGSNGSIMATGGGGTPGAGYQYSLSGPVSFSFSSGNVFNNLPAGTYTVTAKDANGCTASVSKIITEPSGTRPDVILSVADYTDNFFPSSNTDVTLIFQISEIGGNPALADLLRITKQSGYNFSLVPNSSVTTGFGTYVLDNSRWTADDSDPNYFRVSISSGQQINCGQSVFIGIKISRTNPSKSVFTLTAQMRNVTNENNTSNNATTFLLVGQ